MTLKRLQIEPDYVFSNALLILQKELTLTPKIPLKVIYKGQSPVEG